MTHSRDDDVAGARHAAGSATDSATPDRDRDSSQGPDDLFPLELSESVAIEPRGDARRSAAAPGVRWPGLRTGRIDCGHHFGAGHSVVQVGGKLRSSPAGGEESGNDE